MVNVLVNLNATLCHVFIHDKDDIPPPVNIMLDSSKDENQHANTYMVSDDDGANWTSKRLAKWFKFLKE